MMNNSLLCIAAHPDDEVLSCGALLAGAARLGWKIHFAWATIGEKSRSVAASTRWTEAVEVADTLGASAEHFGLADGQVTVREFTPLADKIVRELKPTLIVSPCGTSPEQHQDHRAVHESMLNIAGRSPYASSCFCVGQPPVDPDPSFCAPQLYFGFGEALLHESAFLMGIYRSESQKHFAGPHFLRSRAEQWAARARTRAAFAEPFMLVKGIPPMELFAVESNSYRLVSGHADMETTVIANN